MIIIRMYLGVLLGSQEISHWQIIRKEVVPVCLTSAPRISPFGQNTIECYILRSICNFKGEPDVLRSKQ